MVLSGKHGGMNPSRLLLLVVAGCCLLRPESLLAQEVPSPFGPNLQYSADIVVTTPKDQMTQKIYSDNKKVRSEINTHGMSMVLIVRPDLQKIYTVMVDRKMVMESTYDPNSSKLNMTAAMEGKYELAGPDVVDGTACLKYKMTNKSGEVSFIWVNAATKAPVKVTSEDGSVTMAWKNYQAGPQDAALFEPPAGYQVMSMPGGMGMPGGGGQ